MPVKTEMKDGLMICRVEGDINLNTAAGIKKEFAGFLEQKPSRVIINFSKVAYIDSSGLGMLVEILKRVKGYGGSLKLTDLSAKIKSMFEIIQFNKIFDIMDNEEGAIAAFK
jgi:anti-sigma B factor antagonist